MQEVYFNKFLFMDGLMLDGFSKGKPYGENMESFFILKKTFHYSTVSNN